MDSAEDFVRERYDETGRLLVYDQQTADLVLNADLRIINNVAVSRRQAYFLTAERCLIGLNGATGETEALVKFSPEDFYRHDSMDYHAEQSPFMFL